MKIKDIFKVGEVLGIDIEHDNKIHTLVIPASQIRENDMKLIKDKCRFFIIDEEDDEETEFDNIDDEIDSALDLIADVVSSEELFVIEQKLKEKYGVK